MSPELIDPEESDPSKGMPTRKSDCYALGMVIYEVLTGEVPFARWSVHLFLVKVLKGVRPDRPRGAQVPDGVWETLRRCWEHRPNDRPSLDAVLRCLQDVAPRRAPPPGTEINEGDRNPGSTMRPINKRGKGLISRLSVLIPHKSVNNEVV